MHRKESAVLADVFEKCRELTNFYVSNMKSIDPLLQPTLGGVRFNSLYWQVAHLLWAEHNLLVRCTGGESLAPKWLGHYKIGSDGSLHEGHSDFNTLLNEMKSIHRLCMDYLRTFPDEKLGDNNPVGFQFGDDKSNRVLIQHAIRHESMHTGQIAYFGKLMGITLV